jgi:hypothetical protein
MDSVRRVLAVALCTASSLGLGTDRRKPLPPE